MAKQRRPDSVAEARGNGIDEGEAEALFDLMEKFGGYGFDVIPTWAFTSIAYPDRLYEDPSPGGTIPTLLTSWRNTFH